MTVTTKINHPLLELMPYGPATFHQPMTREEFIAFNARFPDWQMEREKDGKITIMTPVKKGSGKRESIVNYFIHDWYYNTDKGEVYSASTGIELPDGSIKSPDSAWVSDEKLDTLPEEADEDFVQVIPDFVVEVRSSTDRLKKLKAKMKEVWMANGVRLGWLIDPYSEKVWIYRGQKEVEEIAGFDNKFLSGEDVMPGLKLPLEKLKGKRFRKKKK